MIGMLLEINKHNEIITLWVNYCYYYEINIKSNYWYEYDASVEPNYSWL